MLGGAPRKIRQVAQLDGGAEGEPAGRVLVARDDDKGPARGTNVGGAPGVTGNLGRADGSEERVARHFMVAPFQIARGCTATYFPEANVLVPIESTADRSNTPVSKSVVIAVAPSGDEGAAVEKLRQNAREARR